MTEVLEVPEAPDVLGVPALDRGRLVPARPARPARYASHACPTRNLAAILLAWAGLWGGVGCGDLESPMQVVKSADGAGVPLGMVATTGMIGDMVRSIAGDRGTVTVLMGEGVDPHLFKPTASDVRRLLAADLVFHNGLFLEGRMGSVLSAVDGPLGMSVAVAEGLPESSLLLPDGAEAHPDPHVWMDVQAWSSTIGPIVTALCEVDPVGCDLFRANAEMLEADLAELDRYVHEVIGSIPPDRRVLVTAHDAFGYFGRAYGLDVQGIQGISTESEAGLADMNRLVQRLVDGSIPAVFVESSVSEKNVRALVEGAAAQGHTVVIGGELFSDAMGSPDSWEGTYPGMIDHNASIIAAALGGDVPDGGFRAWRPTETPEETGAH